MWQSWVVYQQPRPPCFWCLPLLSWAVPTWVSTNLWVKTIYWTRLAALTVGRGAATALGLFAVRICNRS